MLELEDERTSPTLIKVVGVGGGGMNAVNRMIDASMRGVEFYVVNTDEQVLRKSSAENRIQIGQRATRGMGAGGDPDIGHRAAMEDKETIAQALKGADMVFVTAGMGGGTGTGAAPIVAETAREQGSLVVGVVTLPFEVEGRKRMELARRGIAQLREKVDTLITIKNESLFKIIDRSTSVHVAFRMVDEILLNAVKGISDLINTAGIVNVDFADVRSIMGETGDAIMGAGEGIGENRVADAVAQAINNALLEESSIEGATALLINVQGGDDMSMTEWKEVSEIITERADDGANIIIGLTVDDSLHDRIRVTVIATGFQKSRAERQPVKKAAAGHSVWREFHVADDEAARRARHPVLSLRQREAEVRADALAGREAPIRQSAPIEFDEDELEPIEEDFQLHSRNGGSTAQGRGGRGATPQPQPGRMRPESGAHESGARPHPPRPVTPEQRAAVDPNDLDIPAYLRRNSR